eukprot:2166898-Pyramimonas_sp.AAC.1
MRQADATDVSKSTPVIISPVATCSSSFANQNTGAQRNRGISRTKFLTDPKSPKGPSRFSALQRPGPGTG